MITPLLLCGGFGTRLWPLSRKSYPKQFVPLVGEESLFQASVRRLGGEGYSDPVVLTGSDFRFIVTEQLAEIGQTAQDILIEPEGRDTGPALLAAALHVLHTAPEGTDPLLLAAPSDHVVPDAPAFRAAVDAGRAAAQAGQIVTFGIRPTRPETGYGYLQLSQIAAPGTQDPIALKRFVEKPDAPTAAAMLASGDHLWNAGIFLFSAKTLIAAYTQHAPDMIDAVTASVTQARKDLDFTRMDAEAWAKVDPISVDYAIMERADNLMVIPFDGAWSDLGGWDAVWREADQDDACVVTSGEATAVGCENTLLRSEDPGLEVVGIGLKNTMVVALPDAVLVADMSCAQDVKKAVSALKKKGAHQAEQFPKDHRPWGWFESLVIGERFQVKRIVVHPGAALSLQSHHHRAEHWIVVAGTAKVTVDETVKLVTENQSIYIPLGAVHRMENPGKVPMILIEVQTGSYLGEDDIIRYEDVYARD